MEHNYFYCLLMVLETIFRIFYEIFISPSPLFPKKSWAFIFFIFIKNVALFVCWKSDASSSVSGSILIGPTSTVIGIPSYSIPSSSGKHWICILNYSYFTLNRHHWELVDNKCLIFPIFLWDLYQFSKTIYNWGWVA